MKKLLFYSTILYSSLLFAEPKCSLNGTKSIYINGVFTTREEAFAAVEIIESLKFNEKNVYKLIDSTNDGSVVLSYNTNKGNLQDLYESHAQKLITEHGLTRDQAWHSVYLILNENTGPLSILQRYGLGEADVSGVTPEFFDNLKDLEIQDTENLKKLITDSLVDKKR